MKTLCSRWLLAIECLALSAGFSLSPLEGAEGAEATAETAAPAKIVGKMITLGDFGAEDLGYLTLPLVPPIGGVVIIPDRFGLDDNTKRLTEEFAGKGYLAISVDLYNGRTTNDAQQANTLLSSIRLESAMKTIQAGERLLKESPRLKVPRVAIVGYNSGGTIAILAAQQIKDVDAVAALNAMIAPRNKKISKYRVPICMVCPSVKEGDMPAGMEDFQKLMNDMNNPLEVYYLQGLREGFADPRSAVYDTKNAATGWQMLDDFLKREFAKPPRGPSIIDKVEGFFK